MINKMKGARLLLLLVMCLSLTLLLLMEVVETVVAVVGDPLGDTVDYVGDQDQTGLGWLEGTADSRNEGDDRVKSEIESNWGDAGAFAEELVIIMAILFAAPMAWSLFKSLKAGLWGAAIAIAFLFIAVWAMWGMWDQLTKGHVVPFVLYVGALLLGLGGVEDWSSGAVIAALVLYFSVVLDPLVTQWGLWDSINVLRLSGADSWADLINI